MKQRTEFRRRGISAFLALAICYEISREKEDGDDGLIWVITGAPFSGEKKNIGRSFDRVGERTGRNTWQYNPKG